MKQSNILTKKQLQTMQERLAWAEYERDQMYSTLKKVVKKK